MFWVWHKLEQLHSSILAWMNCYRQESTWPVLLLCASIHSIIFIVMLWSIMGVCVQWMMCHGVWLLQCCSWYRPGPTQCTVASLGIYYGRQLQQAEREREQEWESESKSERAREREREREGERERDRERQRKRERVWERDYRCSTVLSL